MESFLSRTLRLEHSPNVLHFTPGFFDWLLNDLADVGHKPARRIDHIGAYVGAGSFVDLIDCQLRVRLDPLVTGWS